MSAVSVRVTVRYPRKLTDLEALCAAARRQGLPDEANMSISSDANFVYVEAEMDGVTEVQP